MKCEEKVQKQSRKESLAWSGYSTKQKQTFTFFFHVIDDDIPNSVRGMREELMYRLEVLIDTDREEEEEFAALLFQLMAVGKNSFTLKEISLFVVVSIIHITSSGFWREILNCTTIYLSQK